MGIVARTERAADLWADMVSSPRKRLLRTVSFDNTLRVVQDVNTEEKNHGSGEIVSHPFIPSYPVQCFQNETVVPSGDNRSPSFERVRRPEQSGTKDQMDR